MKKVYVLVHESVCDGLVDTEIIVYGNINAATTAYNTLKKKLEEEFRDEWGNDTVIEESDLSVEIFEDGNSAMNREVLFVEEKEVISA